MISANYVWQRERKKVQELEKKLIPKLDFAFSNSIPGCIVYAPSRENAEYKCFRLKVTSRCATRLTDCTGYLRSISNNWSNFCHQPVKLTFAPAEDSDTLSKNIEFGVEVFLDILLINRETRQIQLCTPNFRLPNDFDIIEFFRGSGEYLFELHIASKEAVVQKCILKLNWANNWAMANMELVV